MTALLEPLETALGRPAVLAPVLLAVAYLAYQLFLRPSGLPSGIPIVGARPGEWFPLARARWRNAKDMKTATEVAYGQYRDEAVVLPVAGAQDFVQLPARELQWLVDQPDADVDLHEQVLDSLQLDFTVTDPRLVHDPVHQKLISTVLTRETGNLVPALLDEIRFSVDELWGADDSDADEGFREICAYDAMRRIIGQVTNRVFVGLPLCRNQDLLDAGLAYAQDVPVGSTILRFTPAPLRPLLAPLVTLPNRIHTRRFYGILRPEVERRLAAFAARRADPEKSGGGGGGSEKEPNDFLQWSIAQAAALGGEYHSHPDTLSGRILLLNFASIHTSSFAITHALLDLAAAPPAHLDELRAEISSVLAAHGGAWNKRALAAMEKLDSVMRESQRVNSFVTIATARRVVREGGVTTPSGVRVPKGVVLCAPSYPVFHDPEKYPGPDEFRPFRFAEKRAAPTAGGGDGKEGEEPSSSSYVQRARQAFATTSPEYTAFGHGRHACPGRFFASSELKLMLAYIVMHYDIERLERRPDNFWFGLNRIPPMKATIRVRRRREAV
ncbi:cytochrome P450 [Hypoxylon rubiginosum]|uniref:Cytochrome P450 n=1 Tax=Hypoxylon rubiginosum TaxID=110542 RepID=A0ACB9Z652_9PEZI|nr:cytochrome P450 [Hypoxylon rubiginosum]